MPEGSIAVAVARRATRSTRVTLEDAMFDTKATAPSALIAISCAPGWPSGITLVTAPLGTSTTRSALSSSAVTSAVRPSGSHWMP